MGRLGRATYVLLIHTVFTVNLVLSGVRETESEPSVSGRSYVFISFLQS